MPTPRRGGEFSDWLTGDDAGIYALFTTGAERRHAKKLAAAPASVSALVGSQ